MADLELGNAAPPLQEEGRVTGTTNGLSQWISQFLGCEQSSSAARVRQKNSKSGFPAELDVHTAAGSKPRSRRQRAESQSLYFARCPPTRQLAIGPNRPSPRHRRYPHGRTLILRRASHSMQTGRFQFRWPAGSEKLARHRFSGRSALDPGFPRGITALLLHGNSCGSGSGNPGRTARWVDSVARLGSHAAGKNSPLEL